jgi:hypothetical protein
MKLFCSGKLGFIPEGVAGQIIITREAARIIITKEEAREEGISELVEFFQELQNNK